MDRFFYDSEEYGTPDAEESSGFLSLKKTADETGVNLRDLTDIVFDPTNPIDYALVPLLMFPPAAVAFKLAQAGYKGKKL